jgi:hypothetical protein
MPRDDGEVEAVTVDDTRWDRDLDYVMQKQRAGALA